MTFAYSWNPSSQYDHELVNAVTGGGVCVGDYDNDGLVDLFLTQPFGGNRLYRNLGKWKFQDVTDAAGLTKETDWGTGASFADIDNDGDLDLYVCGYDVANRLYVNQGNGTFLEKATAAGVDYRGASIMIAFADYDLDGDL
ncbi:MAG: VCBS repeat-containing protein, partial [Verrucomicrobiota bacterium]